MATNRRNIRKLFLVAEDAISKYEKQDVATAVAAIMILIQMHRGHQMLTSCELVLRQLQLLIKLRKRRVSGTTCYCLPTKFHSVVAQILSCNFDMARYLSVTKTVYERVCRMTQKGKEHGWSEKLEVVIFLYWMASGTAFRTVASKFGIPKSTISDIVHRVLHHLLRNLRQVVQLSNHESQLEEIGKGFSQKTGSLAFSRAVGCLGTLLIPVKPPKNMEQIYLDSSGHYSIKCQLVCDHRGIIQDVFAGYPGSMSDNQLLTFSPLVTKRCYPTKNHFLLASSQYSYTEKPSCVVPPYVCPTLTTSKVRFNMLHNEAMTIIQEAVQDMRSKWFHIFHSNLGTSTKLAPRIVVACIMLHNICRAEKVWEEEHSLPAPPSPSSVSAETTVRQNLPNGEQDLREQMTQLMILELYHTPAPVDHSYLG